VARDAAGVARDTVVGRPLGTPRGAARAVRNARDGRQQPPGTAARGPGVRHGPGIIEHMTVVKINAITVPADSGDELARRFAARAGAVDSQDGFEGFELLKPTDERTTWLVVTRWRDEPSFQAWLHSPAFGHGHRSAAERGGGESAPVGVSSELWSYVIAGGSAG
jgi:heme-degrading monooxygenase HmoA